MCSTFQPCPFAVFCAEVPLMRGAVLHRVPVLQQSNVPQKLQRCFWDVTHKKERWFRRKQQQNDTWLYPVAKHSQVPCSMY